MSVQQLIKFEIFISTNIIYLKAYLSRFPLVCCHRSTRYDHSAAAYWKEQYIVLKARTKRSWVGWVGQDFPCLLSSHRA
jgi:hypothetical protein